MSSDHDGRTGIADVLLIWAVLALVEIEIFVTYTRIPIHELYHVRQGGVADALTRIVAFIGFPCGLVAIGGLGVVAQRLPRRAAAFSGVAVALVAAGVLWPGGLGEAGLEARPARIAGAAGVAFAIALTAIAVRARGVGRLGRERWDVARLVLALVLLVAALPWLASDLGFALNRVPLLNAVFQTDALTPSPGQPGRFAAVHDGHHHGMDGVLLALAALFLSRTLRLVHSRPIRLATGFYLSFILVYGLANALQDFWLEQIVKRGWTTSQLPLMLVPSLRPAWAVIIALSVAVFVIVVIALRVASRGQEIPRTSSHSPSSVTPIAT